MAATALVLVNSALSRVGEKPITQTQLDTPPASLDSAVVAAREYVPTRNEELQLHPWTFALVRATLLAYTTPAATLTPAATTGTGINFTASAAVFTSADVGKTLENQAGTGVALITGFTSTTVVVATITTDFPNTSAIASGSWRLYYAAPAYSYARSIPRPAAMLRLLRVRHQVPYRAEGQNLVTDADSLDVVYLTTITDTTLHHPAFDEVLISRLAMKFCYSLTGKLDNLQAVTQLYDFALKRAKEAHALEEGEGEWEDDASDRTQATIIQDAIARLRAQSTQGPLDPIDLTATANRLYPNALDELQRMHPWRFTRQRVVLDTTTTVTLTPGATTGDGITFTAGGAFFEADHVGLRLMALEGGVARIVSVSSTTVVVANIEETFDSTDAIVAGDWHLAPAWRWTYRYTPPTGFLRLLEVQEPVWGFDYTGVSLQPTQEAVVLEGDVLVSDQGPTLKIEYVKRVSDPALFEAGFTSVFAAFLAWRMALPVTQSPQIEQVMKQAFAAQLKAVRTADKLDTTVPPIRYAPLTIARR